MCSGWAHQSVSCFPYQVPWARPIAVHGSTAGASACPVINPLPERIPGYKTPSPVVLHSFFFTADAPNTAPISPWCKVTDEIQRPIFSSASPSPDRPHSFPCWSRCRSAAGALLPPPNPPLPPALCGEPHTPLCHKMGPPHRAITSDATGAAPCLWQRPADRASTSVWCPLTPAGPPPQSGAQSHLGRLAGEEASRG
jgi:hypothetical protein